jgi:hypothetical protein
MPQGVESNKHGARLGVGILDASNEFTATNANINPVYLYLLIIKMYSGVEI